MQSNEHPIIPAKPSRHSREGGNLTTIATADLTKRAPVYLIRASAPYAQVAQSVEQRTENTGNSRGKPKNRNGFL